MRTFILILAALLTWGQLAAREVVNINRNWRFFCDCECICDDSDMVYVALILNTVVLSGNKY